MANNKEQLLIVDDEMDICLLLADIFKADYEVNHAQTIEDAKEMVKENKPGILLLDLDLPDGSGFDLLPFIKNIEAKEEKVAPCVVIISAHKGKEEQEIAESYNVDFFIEKPLDIGTIQEVVSSFNKL